MNQFPPTEEDENMIWGYSHFGDEKYTRKDIKRYLGL